MRRFEGKNILVTGASRGLGRSIASAFGEEGAFVWVHYAVRELEALKTLAAVKQAGGQGALVQFDLRDLSAVQSAIQKLVQERGAPDVLVNNAAIVNDGVAVTLPLEDFGEVLAVNLTGMFACCQAIARPMMARRSGAIVNVASISAMGAPAGQVAYAASKAGVLALTRTLAMELAPKGVRVNAVTPGLFDAGIGERLDKRVAGSLREQIPAGRAGAPKEMAAAVLFLASDDASYIFGHSLVVDGGLSL